MALKFILMPLMLYVAGSWKHCLQLKFQQLLNGNSEGVHVHLLILITLYYGVISTLCNKLHELVYVNVMTLA